MYSLAGTLIILIHGTWGTSSDWHQPGGHFHDMLEMQAQKYGACVVPFCWSGSNSNQARETAAHSLVNLIKSYPTKQQFYVVAHSHGGNVAALASQLMTKHAPLHKIESLYLLGTPARADYVPNMEAINYVYNIVSFQDFIQPVINIFNRGQPMHPRITNISITIDDKEPGHSDMHHYSIGLWLLSADRHIRELHNSFQYFAHGKPGIIHFYTYQEPVYAQDDQWDIKIEKDKRLQERVVNSILRKPQSHMMEY